MYNLVVNKNKPITYHKAFSCDIINCIFTHYFRTWEKLLQLPIKRVV